MSVCKLLKVFMKVWYHFLIKRLLGQNPTVLESVGIREEKTPHKIITLLSIGALASTVNDMYIA